MSCLLLVWLIFCPPTARAPQLLGIDLAATNAWLPAPLPMAHLSSAVAFSAAAALTSGLSSVSMGSSSRSSSSSVLLLRLGGALLCGAHGA